MTLFGLKSEENDFLCEHIHNTPIDEWKAEVIQNSTSVN